MRRRIIPEIRFYLDDPPGQHFLPFAPQQDFAE
jgi:hypothetical protein